MTQMPLPTLTAFCRFPGMKRGKNSERTRFRGEGKDLVPFGAGESRLLTLTCGVHIPLIHFLRFSQDSMVCVYSLRSDSII